MISRQKTARALLTPNKIMQLPPNEEIILVSSTAPIQTQKVQYFHNTQLTTKIHKPPNVKASATISTTKTNNWSSLQPIIPPQETETSKPTNNTDSNIRQKPKIPKHENMAPKLPFPREEFAALKNKPNNKAQHTRTMQTQFHTITHQAALDPDNNIKL